MALIVQKYGGTSVADADRIKAVAEHVAFTKRQGYDLVVVVSAMGKETDNLIALANAVSATLPGREMDMLLTIGERKTMALLCMALADLGVDAVSFTGSQVGIITDNVHGKAKILEVRGRPGPRPRWPTGRSASSPASRASRPRRRSPPSAGVASDLTAVALAAAFQAASCEIYTDVTGVFSSDPRLVPQARKLNRVHFDEMLEIAAAGGRVLALRSVEFARNHNVALHVRSSFTWEPGTWVTNEEPSMEDPIISAVVHDVSRVQGDGQRRARPARRLGGAVRAAGRVEHQRRHDRAEHLQGRHDRHLASPCPRPTWAWPRSRERRGRARSAPAGSATRATSPRSRSSARA